MIIIDIKSLPNTSACPKFCHNQYYHQIQLQQFFFQFCTPINDIKPCTSRQTALTVTTMITRGTEAKKMITAHCLCSEKHYWKHFKTTRSNNNLNNTSKFTKQYKCNILNKCHTNEFCGNVRTDQNSIYYQCSCPQGHYCVYKNRTEYHVEEPLYAGKAYRAICEPQDKKYIDF